MCGIAGAIGYDLAIGAGAVEEMCRQMKARGPDDVGIERRGSAIVGSRRLAIIDTSLAGHQPMRDDERGLTLVFNGMIYNFTQLRERLERDGETFQSLSDTEVVLRAYARWGSDCVHELEGMFAFAVWDQRAAELFLARDPMGIKPLYYRHDGPRLLFASQVRALLSTRLVEPRLSPRAVATFLAYGGVSEPLTAVEGVLSLPAGHCAHFSRRRLEINRYYVPATAEGPALAHDAAVDLLRRELEETVGSHLVSDVPIGVFLSGGLDSSIIAAIAARATPHVRTVSVTFDDPLFSEEVHMRRVADAIGSDHVVVPLRPSELVGKLDAAFAAMDQPTFDGINTYVVSRAAAESGLRVALSGLGGDELFDGYGYLRRVVALERVRRLPRPAAAVAAAAIGRVRRSGRADKAAEWLGGSYEAGSAYELLRRLFSPHEVRSLSAVPVEDVPVPDRLNGANLAEHVAWLDLANYTRNVLLRDTDSMSMANSLEVRVPFLHRPFVERTFALPTSLRTAPNKALLTAVARDLLPQETLSRRKQGFVLPLAAWMRGELRPAVDRTLRDLPELLSGSVRGEVASRIWETYLQDGRRWHRAWALYALARWAHSVEAVS